MFGLAGWPACLIDALLASLRARVLACLFACAVVLHIPVQCSTVRQVSRHAG